MNKDIRNRISCLARWLKQVFQEGEIIIATTESTYFVINNKKIRMSDHVSNVDNLQIIFSPIKKEVLLLDTRHRVNYFGKISEIKNMMYVLITSDFITLLTPPVNLSVSTEQDHKITFEKFMNICSSVKPNIYKLLANFIKSYFFSGEEYKAVRRIIDAGDLSVFTPDHWNKMTKKQYDNILQCCLKYKLIK